MIYIFYLYYYFYFLFIFIWEQFRGVVCQLSVSFQSQAAHLLCQETFSYESHWMNWNPIHQKKCFSMAFSMMNTFLICPVCLLSIFMFICFICSFLLLLILLSHNIHLICPPVLITASNQSKFQHLCLL